MSNDIIVGDIVIVNFYNAQTTLSFEAEVIYKPYKIANDPWVFKDLRSGDVHYVTEGCTITKKINKEGK